MTMTEVIEAVVAMSKEQRVQWLIDLGWAMTVSARGGYPLAKQAEPVPHLMAFNELQHQFFNYLRHSRTKDDWTIQSFLEGLHQNAKASKVEGDFGWAVKWSMERTAGTTEGSEGQLEKNRR
jgi:hypothetical protein